MAGMPPVFGQSDQTLPTAGPGPLADIAPLAGFGAQFGSEVNVPTFGGCQYTLDREATIAAYRMAASGGADECDCAGCRNFRLAREVAYPPSFLALLDELGIDPLKDGEVYHNARMSAGQHQYGGWFHFVGAVQEVENSSPVVLCDGFSAWMCRASAPRLSSLKGLLVVELNFLAEAVPWLLSEPEMT